MKEELNLPCQYKVIIDPETFTYSFTTKNDIEYNIVFADSMSYFSESTLAGEISNVYTVIIDKVSIGTAAFDSEVQYTIDCVITHFFNDTANSIVYYCDNSDSRELVRKRKFNAWYDKSDFRQNTTKIDEEIIIEGSNQKHFTTILYHNDNPFKDSLVQAYYEIINELHK